MKLRTDKYLFVIVSTVEEWQQAKAEKHLNVKVECPECGKQMLRTLNEAADVMEYGCLQHAQAEEPIVIHHAEPVRFNNPLSIEL